MPDLISVFLPMIVLMLVGFTLGKKTNIDLKTVGTLAIYCFTPIVGFGGTAQLDITPSLLLLPVITFVLASLIGCSFYILGKKTLSDSSLPYLLPVATGSGNTGYFGLPVAMALLGSEVTGIYLVAMLGITIFESTIGYYFINRGGLTSREALIRVMKLPLIYALAAGLIVASVGVELPAPALKLWEMAKGAYVCVGMMIVGIALGQQKNIKISLPLLGLGIAGKFIVWPLLAILFVIMDQHFAGIFTPTMHHCILLLSVSPMAANLAAYASQSQARVDQAAALILVTTIMAVIALPLIAPFLISL